MRLFLFLAATVLAAQDWTQWRGTQRTGTVSGFTAPTSWPKQLSKVWSAPTPAGFSTPVVAANSIFVFARDGEQEALLAIDSNSGKTLWRKSYSAAFEKNKYATEMGKGPHSTPVLHDGKVITLGITGVLSCWNASNGALVWRKDFSKRIDTTKLFTGTATSPLIDGGTLFLHIGDDRAGSMLALDPATGNQKWSWDGDGASYSSPIAATINGVRQLIALTLKHAVGLDIRSGALLWQIDFKDEWNENIVTPVVYGNRVILSGVRRGTIALDPAATPPRVVWENAESAMYVSSPVLAGDYLYGMSSKRKGALFCLDARTGKLLWSTTGREGANMSLTAVGNLLFALNDSGDLKILRQNPAKYEEVASYKVSEVHTWPQPLVLGNQLLVRDDNSLTLYSLR